MANMQESSPVFFSQRAQRFVVFIYMKQHFVFSVRSWRLYKGKQMYIQALILVLAVNYS